MDSAMWTWVQEAPDRRLHELVACGAWPWVEQETQDVGAAQKAFSQALSLYPSSWDCWNFWGVSLAKLERYEEAVAKFSKGLQVKPGDKSLQENLQQRISLLEEETAGREDL